MTFVPRHYKKRNPLDRQVLGVYRPPPKDGCARPGCGAPWRMHTPDGDGRGYCNDPDCTCPEFVEGP